MLNVFSIYQLYNFNALDGSIHVWWAPQLTTTTRLLAAWRLNNCPIEFYGFICFGGTVALKLNHELLQLAVACAK